jgi:hypothetical protein
MSAPLALREHAEPDFALPLPPDWEVAEDFEGCALIAVEPPRADGHIRANVTVTVEILGDEPLAGWAERTLGLLPAALPDLWTVDREDVELAGRPALRSLSHYRHHRFGGVNLEQWMVRDRALGFVTSCTTAALEYDDLWPLMQAIAHGLRLP